MKHPRYALFSPKDGGRDGFHLVKVRLEGMTLDAFDNEWEVVARGTLVEVLAFVRENFCEDDATYVVDLAADRASIPCPDPQ